MFIENISLIVQASVSPTYFLVKWLTKVPSGLDVTCKRGERFVFCEEAAGQQPSPFSSHGVGGGLGKNRGKNRKDIKEPTSAPQLLSVSSGDSLELTLCL